MHIVRCECGFVFNQKAPTQAALTRFYNSSKAMVTWAMHKQSRSQREKQKQKFSWAVNHLMKAKVKSVLDVGCGTGAFLKALKDEDKFLRTLGVDTNAASLGVAKLSGIRCIHTDIYDFDTAEQLIALVFGEY